MQPRTIAEEGLVCEAIEQARTAGGDQIRLAASPRRMRGIP